MHADSYLICSTPRTGSTLLCGLLESTGVAGRPKSYFRQPDEQSWAALWDIVRSTDHVFDYADYARAALAAGRTENEVFAARIMWGSMEELVEKLGAVYPDIAGADLHLLKRAFGNTRFVYLQRTDVLAQAVSWCRAEQTNIWQETDQPESRQSVPKPSFDFEQIHELIQVINEHNAAWHEWFSSLDIQPYLVRYEDLVSDPIGVTCNILDLLKLELPPEREILVRHRRLADDINIQWIERYRTEMAQ